MCIIRDMSNISGRGFRVALQTDPTKRKGIFAKSLQDLLEKVRFRFELEKLKTKDLKVFTVDGTEVDDDDYFLFLPKNCLLVVSLPGSKVVDPCEAKPSPDNIFDHVLSLLRWSGGVDSVYKDVLEFMRADFKDKYRVMLAGIDASSNKTLLSKKEDDPDWFGDLSTNASTKEEFMSKNCQGRIRGYLARAEQQLKDLLDPKKRGHVQDVEQILEAFRTSLKKHKYHGHYFDRSALTDRICDDAGGFSCEGRYSEAACGYRTDESGDAQHHINPYSTREARILFSTWNLDHVIERSRSVVPALVEAIRSKGKRRKINTDYFYSLLFTRTNLKLVHIVCHDKQEHSDAKCDTKRFYV